MKLFYTRKQVQKLLKEQKERYEEVIKRYSELFYSVESENDKLRKKLSKLEKKEKK